MAKGTYLHLNDPKIGLDLLVGPSIITSLPKKRLLEEKVRKI